MRGLLAAGAIAVALVGCTADRRPAMPAAAPARRVVSLIPSITDLVVAMGAADRLVGRTRFDTDPRLARLPSVGGTLSPSLEAIVMLHPDLVFVWPKDDLTVPARLAQLGVPTLAVGTETIGELRDALLRVGSVLGMAAQAESLRLALDDSLAAVRARQLGRPRPAVLWLLGPQPLITVGPGTFISDLIEVAGGRNVFADAGSNWPTVGLEAVLARDPDVIVWPRSDSVDGAALLGRLPGWRRLRAVRGRRVVVVSSDLLNRPGPRLGEAASVLADALARAVAPQP